MPRTSSIRSAVSKEFRLVTDRQTDAGPWLVSALAYRCAGENCYWDNFRVYWILQKGWSERRRRWWREGWTTQPEDGWQAALHSHIYCLPPLTTQTRHWWRRLHLRCISSNPQQSNRSTYFSTFTILAGAGIAFGWLTSRVVGMLDSGAEGPGFKSGNSLRQTVHTHRGSVHQAAKLVAALLRVAMVTGGK